MNAGKAPQSAPEKQEDAKSILNALFTAKSAAAKPEEKGDDPMAKYSMMKVSMWIQSVSLLGLKVS